MQLRVFIFDDEELVRSVLSRYLKRRGYEVLAFVRAETCDRCPCPAGHTCADVIICDLTMPGRSGTQFATMQARLGCRIENVALMSGVWSQPDHQIASTLGCKILHKPFSMKELGAWLDECETRIDPERILDPWFPCVGHDS